MKWLAGILFAATLGLATAPAATKADPPAAKAPAAVDPVEAEFQRLMAQDDAAHEEIDKWMKENGAFAKQGAGLSEAVLSLKIEQRLQPVKQAYEEFLQRHPKHARAHLAFGSFLNDQGEETDARKEWETARTLDPKNPAAYNNLANSYGQTGPVERAFELYKQAIELNPKQAIYYHNLGAVIVLHRKAAAEHYKITEQQVLRNALELYRLAEQFDPANFQLATDIGQIYYGFQPPDHAAAATAWTRALALARDDLEREATRLHLARVQAAAGKLAEARTHLNSVTNAALAAVKKRITEDLDKQSPTVPFADEPRRTLPSAPK